MYDQPNRCYCTNPNGQLDYLTQHDGVPQKDPLSSALAALALHDFITLYSTAQTQCASTRLSQHNPGDDGLGSVAPQHQYIDDGLHFPNNTTRGLKTTTHGLKKTGNLTLHGRNASK
jgi:hypothetical protein